jgi:hypothetical protein
MRVVLSLAGFRLLAKQTQTCNSERGTNSYRRKPMRKISLAVLALLILALPLCAAAAPFDGSASLMCAVVRVIECGADAECVEVSAETAGIPNFLIIDFENGIIRATEESGRKETSAIQNVQHADGKLILQGAENGRGWSIVIDEDSGRMSASVSDEAVGFVVFGASTRL